MPERIVAPPVERSPRKGVGHPDGMPKGRLPVEDPGIPVCMLAVLLFGLAAAIIHRLAGLDGMRRLAESRILQVTTGLLCLALAAGTWRLRRPLFRMLTSVPFAVAMLTVLLVSTALGTVILQGAPAAEYVARFGSRPAGFLLSWGFDDLFHTLWFNGYLALLAASLLLVAVRKRAWQVPQWGHLASHGGIVVILCGGLVGNLAGFKGGMDLHEGETAGTVLLTKGGTPTGATRPLGFSVRLDAFQAEPHPQAYHVCVYEREGDSFRRVLATDLAQAKAWMRVGPGQAQARLIRTDPRVEVELRNGEGGACRRVFLTAAHDNVAVLEEENGRAVRLLALEAKPAEIKSFRSRLAVLEEGKEVRRDVVEVNHPLSYKGCLFYQADYNPEDPTYSGFLVVKDPGLPLVFAGFAMIAAGVLFVFYVRPRLVGPVGAPAPQGWGGHHGV